jgi:hypothetical protein
MYQEAVQQPRRAAHGTRFELMTRSLIDEPFLFSCMGRFQAAPSAMYLNIQHERFLTRALKTFYPNQLQ